jgi:hypothetical protein
MTNTQRLLAAAALIAEVRQTKNNKARQCECCGGWVKENRGEYQDAVELEAMEAKLRRWAEGWEKRGRLEK